MNYLHTIPVFVAASFVSIASMTAADDEIQQDRQHIAGTWKVTLLVVDGDFMSAESTSKLRVENQPDGTWRLLSDGTSVGQGTSILDPAKSPKSIDFSLSEGDDKEKAFHGIYELGKDTRKLCFAPTEKARPTEFASYRGTGHVLVEFRRLEK